MTTTELTNAYTKYLRSPNFMTHYVICFKYFPQTNTVIELSKGTRTLNQPVFAVTRLTFNDAGERIFEEKHNQPSTPFQQILLAETYYATLCTTESKKENTC